MAAPSLGRSTEKERHCNMHSFWAEKGQSIPDQPHSKPPNHVGGKTCALMPRPIGPSDCWELHAWRSPRRVRPTLLAATYLPTGIPEHHHSRPMGTSPRHYLHARVHSAGRAFLHRVPSGQAIQNKHGPHPALCRALFRLAGPDIFRSRRRPISQRLPGSYPDVPQMDACISDEASSNPFRSTCDAPRPSYEESLNRNGNLAN
jgi:hypothetical protein